MNQLLTITDQLKKRFSEPLPGWDAQAKMASKRRFPHKNQFKPPKNARKGCVLILLYPFDGRECIVFIQRNEYDGIHSGQISFPGGQEESTDGSHAATALREAWEEVGITPEKVNVLGELTSLYIPPSNFIVFPVVGYCTERPDFKPDPSEVQKIIEVNIDRLKDPATVEEREIIISPEFKLSAPCYIVEGTIIWGATAMMLSELMEMI